MYVVMLCCQECFMIPVIFVCVVYSNSQKTVLPNLRMTGPDCKGKMSITAEILDRTFTSGLQILCSSVFLAWENINASSYIISKLFTVYKFSGVAQVHLLPNDVRFLYS